MNNFELVQKMHQQFNLNEPDKGIRSLTKDEYVFRCTAMFEELLEYASATFCLTKIQEDTMMEIFVSIIKESKLRSNVIYSDQFDALLDLGVFTMGTADRQNFPWNRGFNIVMEANMAKQVGPNSKRGGFKRDLVKPDGWTPPSLVEIMWEHHRNIYHPKQKQKLILEDPLTPDVIKANRLIILDGPDCVGKSTLADALIKANGNSGAVIHRTWSKELQTRMDDYLFEPIELFENNPNSLIIIDRNYLSEMVYSNVYRDTTDYKGFHKRVNDKLKELNAIEILCLPSNKQQYLDFHKSKFEEGRDELYPLDGNVEKIYNAYEEISLYGLKTHNGHIQLNNKLTYDMFKNSSELFAESVITYILNHQEGNQ